MVLSVVSAALLFRHLGVADSGRYVTVLSLVALVAALTEAGLTAIGIREYATRPPAERSSVLRSLLGMRIALTTAGVAAAVAFAAAVGYAGVLVAGTLVAGAGLLLQTLQNAATIPLQARLRFGWVTIADLARQLVTVAGIVLLVLAGAELLPFFAVAVPAAVASLAVTVAAISERRELRPSFVLGRWLGLAREALPYAVTIAVAGIYFRAAILVLSLVASAREAGYFGASFRVIDVLVVVPQLLVGAAFPIFARTAQQDRTRMRYALERTLEGALIAGAWVGVSLALGAGLVIDVVAGADFAPAKDVLRIQALALFLAFVNAVLGYALLSLRMYRALLIMSSVALLVVTVLAALLGDAHGAIGGAWATVAGEATLAVAGGAALVSGHPDLRVSPARSVRILLSGAIALSVGLLGLPDAAAVALGTLVLGGALLALRAIPAELQVEGRRLLGGRSG